MGFQIYIVLFISQQDMKTLLTILVSAVSASFPRFDNAHAHCVLKSEVKADCQTVYEAFENTIKKDRNSTGVYNIMKEQDGHYIWVTRNNPNTD